MIRLTDIIKYKIWIQYIYGIIFIKATPITVVTMNKHSNNYWFLLVLSVQLELSFGYLGSVLVHDLSPDFFSSCKFCVNRQKYSKSIHKITICGINVQILFLDERILTMCNTTGATSGAGNNYLSGASEFKHPDI